MVKLLVLGLLMEKDRHPYDIRQTIIGRNWHLTFKVQDGSLYYAVDQLRERGFIEAAEIIRNSGDSRPDKTVYRITEEGRAAFLELLDKQMSQTAFPQHPIFAALPFLARGDRDQTRIHLKKQYEACVARLEMLKGVSAKKEGALPGGAVQLIRGMLKFSLAEKEWLEEVMHNAESGQLFDPKPSG
ncbi:PadR family transcriptional regulator [Paenibacillus soyae]|uniref:PadR family transcriptional regulator n=1 Tax=Paenibacillus soyae TaxID=2969249 RepID=A0A9X2MSQ6_9BACL|nr:PadR family transcriptional regulator [Paenibacillus soyae]MCR2806246.1 PadR family transcriptional regulator [Paenibacillus soyae]